MGVWRTRGALLVTTSIVLSGCGVGMGSLGAADGAKRDLAPEMTVGDDLTVLGGRKGGDDPARTAAPGDELAGGITSGDIAPSTTSPGVPVGGTVGSVASTQPPRSASSPEPVSSPSGRPDIPEIGPVAPPVTGGEPKSVCTAMKSVVGETQGVLQRAENLDFEAKKADLRALLVDVLNVAGGATPETGADLRSWTAPLIAAIDGFSPDREAGWSEFASSVISTVVLNSVDLSPRCEG